MKTFYFYNHQNKQKVLSDALLQNGWRSGSASRADVIFTHVDYGSMKNSLRGHFRRGQKIIIYPHAARPNLFNDFPSGEPFPHVAAQLVTAEGHKQVLESYGYNRPIETIGWYLCPMKPFEPRLSFRKVLFAPIHPNADGSLSAEYKQANSKVFRCLMDLVARDTIDLTVRHIHSLGKNGITSEKGVNYIEGKPDQTYKDIDEADIVVSCQTFGYMAVARGVPTLMFADDIRPHSGCAEQKNLQYVKSWEKYKDLLMYPFDILADIDTLELFQLANEPVSPVRNWKIRMIGEPFDAREFARTVEKYL